MSDRPIDGPTGPTTPLFEETAEATAVRVGPADEGSSGTGSAREQAGAAAGQAKDTAQRTAGVAKEQAGQVAGAAKDAGGRVAGTAKDQASRVASDAAGQARELYGQATSELSDQAGKQQQKAASTLRTFGDDLGRMHQGQEDDGLAAELVQNLSQRAHRVADWLENREPADVLDEVKQFAARRPGLFIALAATAGIVAARATKALVADAKPGHQQGRSALHPSTGASGAEHDDASRVSTGRTGVRFDLDDADRGGVVHDPGTPLADRSEPGGYGTGGSR